MNFYAGDSKTGYKHSTAIGEKENKHDNFASWTMIEPEDYHEVFGSLPKVKAGSMNNVFANGRRMHDNPLIANKNIECFPGAYSFDPEYIAFLKDWVETANKELIPELDEGLFPKNSQVSDFTRNLCISGTYQTPMSYPLKGNDGYRRSLGLPNELTARQRQIFEWVFDIAFGGYDVETVKVPKKSTGGMRRFTSDAQWKITYSRWLMEPNNMEGMLNAFSAGDLYRVCNDYEIVHARYLQKRAQVDAPDKVRMIMSYEYAMSGGAKGELFPANKDVVINGIHYPDFSPMRDRVIHAYSWAANTPMLLIFNGHLRSLFSRFPKTFSVNTASQVKSTFDGKYVEATDVSQFDNTIPLEIFEIAIDVMRKYWDNRLVDYFDSMLKCPVFTRPLGDGFDKGRWLGNPFENARDFFSGNPSGLASTSFFAKTIKQGETLAIVDQIYGFKGPEDIMRYWNHEYSLISTNNGDDELTGSEFKSEFERYQALRRSDEHSIFKVAPEVGQVFSGLTLTKPSDKLEYFPQQRLHVPLERMFNPERSIGGHLRQYAVIGWMERWEQLSRTDEGRHLSDIVISSWNRSPLSKRLGSLPDITANWVRNTRFPNDLNDVERMLYINPEYLHYRDIDMDDVREGVLGMIFSNIPREAVDSFTRNYYNGNINYERQ